LEKEDSVRWGRHSFVWPRGNQGTKEDDEERKKKREDHETIKRRCKIPITIGILEEE